MPASDPRIPLILKNAICALQEMRHPDDAAGQRELLGACLKAARHVARPDPDDLEQLGDSALRTVGEPFSVEWLQLVEARLTRSQIEARPRLLRLFACHLAAYDSTLHGYDRTRGPVNLVLWTPKASERMVQQHALWLLKWLVPQCDDASLQPPSRGVAETSRDLLLLAVLRRCSSSTIAHVLSFGGGGEPPPRAGESVSVEVLERLKAVVEGLPGRLLRSELSVLRLQSVWAHMEPDDRRDAVGRLVQAVYRRLEEGVDPPPDVQAVRKLCDFFDSELGGSCPDPLAAMVRSIRQHADVARDAATTPSPAQGAEPEPSR